VSIFLNIKNIVVGEAFNTISAVLAVIALILILYILGLLWHRSFSLKWNNQD
jgi:hypothetical protein